MNPVCSLKPEPQTKKQRSSDFLPNLSDCTHETSGERNLFHVAASCQDVLVRQPAAQASGVPGGAADVPDGLLLAHTSRRVRGGGPGGTGGAGATGGGGETEGAD